MPVKKITNYDIYFGGYVRKNKRVKKVSLNDISLILYAGDTYDLTFSTYPADGFYEEIEWTSSDPSVASVDENGHIKSIVSCFGDDVKFEVTEENANLLETDIDIDENGKIDISSNIDENGHLIITK